METQLQGIIDKIHAEGVQAAEERAREIIARAEQRAAEKHAEAQKQADALIADAKQTVAKLEAGGRAALQQAGRDTILSVQDKLNALLASVVKEQVGTALSPETIAAAVKTVLDGWANVADTGADVLIDEQQQAAVEKAVRAALAKAIAAKTEITPVRGLGAGFRIGTRDGVAYFDFTGDSVAEVLIAFLNPRLTQIMREAVAE